MFDDQERIDRNGFGQGTDQQERGGEGGRSHLRYHDRGFEAGRRGQACRLRQLHCFPTQSTRRPQSPDRRAGPYRGFEGPEIHRWQGLEGRREYGRGGGGVRHSASILPDFRMLPFSRGSIRVSGNTSAPNPKFVRECAARSYELRNRDTSRCRRRARGAKARGRAVSSAGRASRLHREGRRFEPFTAHQINVSELPRTLTEIFACERGCMPCDPQTSRHKNTRPSPFGPGPFFYQQRSRGSAKGQTASFNSLEARKATFLLALIWIGSPVAGLRPMRAARLRTCRMPKPTMRMRSPFLR